MEAFDGRCPSMSELAQLPDLFLLTLPGFGPKTLRKIRALTVEIHTSPGSARTGPGRPLRAELDRLRRELGDLRDEFEHRQYDLRRRLDLISTELMVHGSALERKA
ncbi:hypothetical protein HPT29_015585 [Microvirga terrae]|uniref:Helix-hairpin-helix domain-containing protein n=1 Tax=Microvirga terrae TaxID=2740529 RepID=A0ABY5RNY0_9HYPH|nr:hypothetical protein [Microvirga terrae]UVF17937.1 hypothetical protein HPT29_015585 [Microvirga terrae]